MATLKSRFRLIIGVDFEDLYSVDNLVSADGESRAALQMVVGGWCVRDGDSRVFFCGWCGCGARARRQT
jgi:hypothetical protein